MCLSQTKIHVWVINSNVKSSLGHAYELGCYMIKSSDWSPLTFTGFDHMTNQVYAPVNFLTYCLFLNKYNEILSEWQNFTLWGDTS